jgi:NADPH-dependent ferric siderophore reductase
MYEPEHPAHEHATHTGETAHHDDRVQYLVVADGTSLDELELQLSSLPLCARGRVFIEVDTAEDVSRAAVPPRMTIAWLTRSTPAARAAGTVLRPRGLVLERAVRAWTAEMLCDGAGATRAILSGEFDTVARLRDHLVEQVGMPADHIVTPPAYRLASH